MKIIYS